MEKTFDVVMPDLKIPKAMEGFMKWLEITKITTTNRHTLLKIYVTAKRLIDKVALNQLEASIKKQYFNDKDLKVRIVERYELSESYSVNKILEEYQSYFLKELKGVSILIYNRCSITMKRVEF